MRVPTVVLVTAVVLAVAIATIYSRAIHAPFIFDDEDIVIKNTSIERLWPPIGTEASRAVQSRAGNQHLRPAAREFLAGAELSHRRVRSGRATTSATSPFISSRRGSCWASCGGCLRLDFFQPAIRDAADRLACLVPVWGLHPLHTETVVYVTQRTELLMSLFYLATLYASLRD